MNGWSRACLAVAVALAVAGCVNAVMMGGMWLGTGVILAQEIRRPGRLCREAMTRMRAHLEQLDRIGSDSLPAFLPVHGGRVEALVSRCGEGKSGKQAGDTVRALGQELRRDLSRLPDLAGEDPSFLAEHRARIVRFLALREGKGRGL